MSIFAVSLFTQGGPMMWVLFVLGVTGSVLFAERVLYLHRGQIRAKAFVDGIKNILGKPCMISVVHNSHDGRTYANIQTVMSMLKGSACPDQVLKTVFYDVDEHDADRREARRIGDEPRRRRDRLVMDLS